METVIAENEAPQAAKLVERQLEVLRDEFPDQAPLVAELGRANLARLRVGATIDDFLPVLVYRFTREHLRSASGEATVPGSTIAAQPDA